MFLFGWLPPLTGSGGHASALCAHVQEEGTVFSCSEDISSSSLSFRLIEVFPAGTPTFSPSSLSSRKSGTTVVTGP
jgi:hypothetical protein